MQVLTRWSWGLPESRQGRVRRGLVRALIVVVILWAGYGLLAGDAGLLRITALNHRTAELAAEVASLESDTRELQKKRDLMLSEAGYLEKVSREEYGLARDGEIVYRFDGGASEAGSLTALFPDSLRAKMVKAAIAGQGQKGRGAPAANAGVSGDIAPQEAEQPGLAIDAGATAAKTLSTASAPAKKKSSSHRGKASQRTARDHRSAQTR